MTLVSFLLRFHSTSVHSHFIFQNIVGQISIFGKARIQIRTKIRALKLLAN